jgi:WD40 repeat protein
MIRRIPMRRGLTWAGVLLSVAVGAAITTLAPAHTDDPPSDAAKRIEQFEGEAEAIRSKADAEVRTSRDKLVEDLQGMQNAYCKAEKLDEAVAVRDRIRRLRADVGEDYAVEIRRLDGNGGWDRTAAFSSDGQTLASVGRDNAVRLWNWRTGKLLASPVSKTGQVVFDADFAPDGKTLATTDGTTVILWDVLTTKQRPTQVKHGGTVRAARFSPDGKTLATASEDTSVFLRHPTGEPLYQFDRHRQWVTALAFSPDGKTLVSGGGNWNDVKTGGEVKAWDLESGLERWSAAGEFAGVWSVAFSPDGKSVAGASIDGTVRVWDAATGEEKAVLKGHTDRVVGVAYTPSGRTLASVGFDGTIRLWDAATGKGKAVLRGHTAPVGRVAFSPDGRVMATTSEDATIRIWQLGRLDGRTGLFVP